MSNIWVELDFYSQMTVAEAREVCRHWWMKEALDILVKRLTSMGEQKDNDDLLETDL